MVYYSLNRYNESMLMVGIIRWWYGDGLKQRIAQIEKWLSTTADMFSISLLLKTLFDPFRQISAAMLPASTPVDVRLRSFGDRLFSRFFGFGIRSLMIIIGSIIIGLQSIFSILLIILWLVAPMSAVIGLVITTVGYL